MRLKRKYIIAIIVFCVLVCGASVIGWIAFGSLTTLVLLSMALVLMLGVFAILAFATFRMMRVQSLNEFAQIESLMSLYNGLDITAPLPPSRGWAVSPDFAAILASLIQEHRPGLVVEAGSGLSTLISAYVLRKNGGGQVISLDHNEVYAAATTRNVAAHGLEDLARVIFAPLIRTSIHEKDWLWYDTKALQNVQSIDILVVDGPPASTQRLARYPALPILAPFLSDNAIIVIDDAFRPDERQMVARWLEEFDGFTARDVDTEKGTVILQRNVTSAG